MESSGLEAPSLENIDCFMVITPVPKIIDDIVFENVFDIDSSEVEFLNEARNELKIALTSTLNDVNLCIRTAEEYLQKLTTSLQK